MADDELMFSMEEVGSLKRSSGSRAVHFGKGSSIDDEDDFYICPITDDPISPAKEICNYLQSKVHSKQLSNSLPKNSFTYQVSDILRSCPYQ